MSKGPLDDLVVIELAGLGAIPFAGMLLADLGATVLQIQRPDDRRQRGLEDISDLGQEIDVVQRGRRVTELDLKNEDDLRLLRRACALADAFMEGFRPGTVERLGIGPEDLLSVNPRLVYARVTGYGQTGPMKNVAGHDINYIAASGILHALSRPGIGPVPPMNLLADYAGGGMLAALAIVSAMLEARTSGRGQTIDLSMSEGVALLGARLLGLSQMASWSPQPGHNFIDGGAPYYAVYETADGKFMAVGALESRFYAALIKGLGIDASDWPDQHDRSAWPRLRASLSACFRSRTQAEWLERYDGTDACVSGVLTFAEAAASPQAQARGSYTGSDGSLQPSPQPIFSRTPADMPPPPEVWSRERMTSWLEMSERAIGGTDDA